MIDRGSFLAGVVAAVLAPTDSLRALEQRIGARLGVAAYRRDGSMLLSYRAHDRLPLASTWKLPLVMTVLDRVAAGTLTLTQPVSFTTRDLEPPYSTIAKIAPHGGKLPLHDVCRLTIADSDNTGADLLAHLVGGPPAVQAYLRRIGVHDVRVDRFERSLPSNALATEPRDTGTPAAMALLARRLIVDSPLSAAHTDVLVRWMRATTTGDARLRAGVAAGWHVADKTGTYANAANDVGLLFPPAGDPLAVAVYVFGAEPSRANGTIASVARLATARS